MKTTRASVRAGAASVLFASRYRAISAQSRMLVSLPSSAVNAVAISEHDAAGPAAAGDCVFEAAGAAAGCAGLWALTTAPRNIVIARNRRDVIRSPPRFAHRTRKVDAMRAGISCTS